MKKLFRSVLVLGLMGGVALLAQPSSAQAAITIELDGVLTTPTVVSSNSVVYTDNPFDPRNATLSITVNRDSSGSTPSLAKMLANTVEVKNETSSVRTVTVTVSQTFTEPIAATMALNSSFEVSAMLGQGEATFTSELNGTSTSSLSFVSPAVVVGGASPKVYVAGVSGSYTLTSITTLTLTAGGSAVVTGTTTAAAAPEPGTIVMAALAAPLLFFGYRRHRRRADSQA